MIKVAGAPKSEKPRPDYRLIYSAGFINAVRRYSSKQLRADLCKTVYYGVKYIRLQAVYNELVAKGMKPSREDLQTEFELIDAVITFMSLLTPRELTRLFPVNKVYDGARHEIKDYFYTMKTLEAHGLDNLIGEAVESILWDYVNIEISLFLTHRFSVVSDLYKLETGKNPIAEFLAESGIDFHTKYTDPATGKEYLLNNSTGKTTAIKKPLPRYLRVVKPNK